MYELFMAVSAGIDKTKMTKLYPLLVLFWNLFCSTYIRKTKKLKVRWKNLIGMYTCALNWISLA